MPTTAISRLQGEEKLLFGCLKQDMSGPDARELVSEFKDISIVWQAIFSIAFVQGVAPLVSVNLHKCREQGMSVPTEILQNFENCRLAAEDLHADRNGKLKELLGFFGQLGEDVMLVKGAAYDAAIFKEPALTVSGDIDLLVKSGTDQFSYDQLQYIYDFNRYESFEVSFQDHHDLDLNQVLPLDYREIWRDARKVDAFGSHVFVMGPEDLLIFACVNSGRKRFFHLNALFKVSAVAGAYPTLDWNVVAEKARRYGCQKIVYAALLATRCSVGCAVPENLAEIFRVGYFRRRLVYYLVENMSFSDLADRTLFLNGGAAVTGLLDKNKWNRSGLLTVAAYGGGQLVRRLKVLLGR